ncbi:hypothetical protein K437DRAFT_54421 [Tilletiaria anomala UBC 951]|uniref:Uncharacterized protein n=1 Tax=Tilletiaria anomala (strain ATCC 24038 / CBS 436.72 / UBC 951) TaxID=1037660 RepID=A0A066V4W0_TILAU|nr:uncharacterized protein K437DRAFT_54421 [Tilletiaria anomala UBC 951]KDN36491.1 hypothetical protein K437DRAFT_54421 [Tilletiaria anomala UBC 951]
MKDTLALWRQRCHCGRDLAAKPSLVRYEVHRHLWCNSHRRTVGEEQGHLTNFFFEIEPPSIRSFVTLTVALLLLLLLPDSLSA